MSKCTNLRRLTLGALALAAGGLAGRAEAACGTDGQPSPAGSTCYVLKGSDTLADIMGAAISGARAGSITAGGVTNTFTPVTGATDLFYAGTGSGNGETALRTATTSGIGVQSLAPMSRNFRPSVIDALSPDFVKRCLNAADPGCTAATPTASGHAAWAPTVANVVGLDAAVFVVKNGVVLDNIDFTTFVDNSVPTAFKKGNVNNPLLPTAFGSGNAFGNLTSTCTTCSGAACPAACVNYNNLMSIIMSGVDGSGTMKACADPRRVQAVTDMAGLLGVTTIAHLFRRDDNSGTTDTFKDRIMVVSNTGAIAARYVYTGGRFCNGTAVGQINGAAPQEGICSSNRATKCFADKDCGTANTPNAPGGCTAAAGPNQCVYCQFNLNNQDFDPIRRPCTPFDGSRAPTSCTDMTTGAPCQFGDGNANCTQGLVVALSDADPGTSVAPAPGNDITTSIGKRVGSSDGTVIGYAGREAALNTGAKALKINTIKSSDENVRASSYLLARRLFIQNSFANSTDPNDVPTDNQTANSVTGGGSDQVTKEQALWTQVLSNRALMDPIVRQYNFIRCASNPPINTGDGGDPAAESGNLCSTTPAAPTPGALSAYIPSGGFGALRCSNAPLTACTVATVATDCPAATPAPTCGSNANVGGAKSVNSAGRVWNGTTAINVSAASGLCVSGKSAGLFCAGGPNSGAVCTVATQATDCTGAFTCGACPDADKLAANSPCTQNSDCASNSCTDKFTHSSGGKDGLYCN
jgi:hypothetical protein